MAFARPIGQPRRSVEAQMIKAQLAEAAPALVAWEAQKQKLVSAKDLKKLRKHVNEKMQNALAVKSEMGSVQEQLKTLSHAVDALSQILVDELDAVGADMRQTKVETSDQLTTLAKGMQAFTHGLSGLKATSDQCKSTAEAASTSIAKLKRWTETGFRRLNEALTVQQQALTVLDSQIAGFNERMHDGHADLVSCRQESADCKAEFERMRTQVSQVLLSNEKLVQEYRDHIRIMQKATANCEMATAEQESRTTMQQHEISHVEALLHEHRAICEARLTALEKSVRDPTPRVSSAFSERRVSELEEDLAQAKRQMSEQDDRIRELQMRLQTQTEKAALTRLSDRQELSELVQRAIHDYMRKTPAARTSTSSYDEPARAWSAYKPHATSGGTLSPPRTVALSNTSPERHRGAPGGAGQVPPRPPSALSSGAALHGEHVGFFEEHGRARSRSMGPVSRVMEESQDRVEAMRRESMQRQLALSRAVEEIDERIRTSTVSTERPF